VLLICGVLEQANQFIVLNAIYLKIGESIYFLQVLNNRTTYFLQQLMINSPIEYHHVLGIYSTFFKPKMSFACNWYEA